jgi:Domain of unknown function (DUF4412)
MQHSKLCLAAVCVLATGTSRLAAQGFNGVIQFASYEDHPSHPDTMTQMTKGSKIRFEGRGMSGGAMIMNGTERIVLIPEQKQYMTLPASFGADQAVKKSSKHHGSASKTGKTETVAGIPCEVWHYEGTGNDGKPEVGDACVAKGAGLMINRLAGGISGDYFDAGGEAFADEMRKGSGLLKVTANGKVQFEAIRAQASSVPDAMFAPPPDYKPMSMPGMGAPRKP